MTREYIPTNWNIIIPSFILMVGTAINGVTAVYMARVQIETQRVVEQTHEAVNSSASKLERVAEAAAAENTRLREEIFALKKAQAVLDERAAERDRPRK